MAKYEIINGVAIISEGTEYIEGKPFIVFSYQKIYIQTTFSLLHLH